jgi:hypothetical protein
LDLPQKKSKEYEMKYDLLKDGRRKEVPKKLRKVLFWLFFKQAESIRIRFHVKSNTGDEINIWDQF